MSSHNLKRFAIILAGGRGERFWPMSRPDMPKQFLTIFNNKPLIQQTLERLNGFFKNDERILIIPRQLKTITRRFATGSTIFIEPMRRNTAPAICLAAMTLERKYGDGIMHVMPADHMIRPTSLFLKALACGEDHAVKGRLITYGIKPTRPETGYGYIRVGERAGKSKPGSKAFPVYTSDGFMEKPALKRARRYLNSGKYLWNAGIFTFRISTLLGEIKQHIPAVFEGVREYMATKNIRYFARIPDVSIDCGIMEKSSKINVILGKFTWDDVGSWSALGRYFKKDARRNICIGNAMGLEMKDTYIYTYGAPVRVYGVNSLIIVASPYGTLVCKKEKAADLKKLLKLRRRAQ
jgi:mannose-1-phosphate guanylyltransferase